MTKILSTLEVEDLDGRYIRLLKPFIFYSDVLKRIVAVPTGFVYDFESVPLLRGTSRRGGTAHDYLCRKDSDPLVTKAIAAAVYREIMCHLYKTRAKNRMQGVLGWIKKWAKWSVVRVAPGYFHKFPVMATYEEIAG